MADDPIDFQFYSLETGFAAQVPRLRAEIEKIQSTDVSTLKPRELGELRDRLLRAKVLLMACDPVQRERLQRKIPTDRKLSFDDFVSYLDLPAVRLI